MRLRRAVIGSIVFAIPSLALGEPQRLGTLWQNEQGSILLTECPPGDHDEYCRMVTVKTRSGVTKLGGGYDRVTVLWSRKTGTGQPDALILGDSGGSGGNADLFAVRLSSKEIFRKMVGERFDGVTVRPGPGPLRVNLPFDIEFFNGASHGGVILLPLPAIWRDNDFAIDLKQLTRRTYSVSELAFRLLALREELHAWADDRFPAVRLYPPEARFGTPVTGTALVEMMLSGHADQARDLLDRAWPGQWDHGDRPLGGKADFWAALCQSVMGEPRWTRFGLARLPHADVIEAGAKPSNSR